MSKKEMSLRMLDRLRWRWCKACSLVVMAMGFLCLFCVLPWQMWLVVAVGLMVLVLLTACEAVEEQQVHALVDKSMV